MVLISKVDFATEKAKATGVQTDFRSYQLAIETVARENAGLSTLVDDAASGEEKYAALEAALNKNLDPKLRVEIDADGKISTDAKDPWKEEYTGQYLAPDADGTVKDRGAIVMYSKGSNLKLGTTSETVNGVVNVTIESGKEAEGADDYAISTIYTYVNGYGEIQTKTEGFSNDIGNVGDTINTPSGDGELDEDVIIEIWMVDSGEPINFTDLAAENNAIINIHLVDTLPDTMIPLDMENGVMDAYILESTGVVYGNLDGTVMTLGQLMADGAAEGTAFDKGWAEDIYLETEDGFYCVRVDTTKMVEVVELWFIGNQDPTNQGESLIEQGVTFKTYLVDEFPETPIQSDPANSKIIAYVLRSSGIAYVNVEGENKPFAEALLGESFAGLDRGWSENIYLETEMGYYCVRTLVKPKAPVATNGGFYDAGGNLLADWDTLVNDYNMSVSKNNSSNEDYAPCNIIANHFPTTSKVVISDTVTRIGSYTFENCTGLTSIDIGSGVKQIGYSAFRSCTGLTGELVIPDNVLYIGSYAFSDCTGLSSLDLGLGVIKIGNNAFEDCTGLTGKLVLPNSVQFIGGSAFGGCSGITGELIIPDGVTVLYNDTFPVWGESTSIVIGSGITIIGQGAGSSAIGVRSISSITIKATTPPALPMPNGLGTLPNLVAIYVPSESVDTYKSATGWSEYADMIQAIPTT